MEIEHRTRDYATTGQLHRQDIAELARRGFRTIICNRPDGEGEGQPSAELIEREAARHGLAFAYHPIVPGEMSDADVLRLRQLLSQGQGPFLAYCRTGARSTKLLERVREASGPAGTDRSIA